LHTLFDTPPRTCSNLPSRNHLFLPPSEHQPLVSEQLMWHELEEHVESLAIAVHPCGADPRPDIALLLPVLQPGFLTTKYTSWVGVFGILGKKLCC
jgi:hypothetical protein